MKRHKRRIETVRVGNAAVKIYRRTRTVDGNRYPTFEVCDYSGRRRRLRSFADHQAVQREARRITKAFPVHPAGVTTAECQRYLDGLQGASSTKNATRQVLWRLFAHCESRGYIPRGSNPIAETQRFNGQRENAIEVWTPDEMGKLLASATRDFLPCLAIGGFAGLRTSEILALDWSDVRLAERTIKVTHRKARCAGTRLAPITENLVKWLSPLAKESGLVWPHGKTWWERARSISAAQNATAEAAGLLPWRHNSLRHSFCAYRVAATQDVPRTALEAGNSAATIFSHYRALATEAEGKAWFAIEPEHGPRT